MTTTIDDVQPESSHGTPWPGSTTARSVRELVAELARTEKTLRRFPDDREASARLRVLVRELRRRRTRGRLQTQLLRGEQPAWWSQ